jgi:hypothetical protein
VTLKVWCLCALAVSATGAPLSWMEATAGVRCGALRCSVVLQLLVFMVP